MDYTMDNTMGSQEDAISSVMSSQENLLDNTMDHEENMMGYTLNHEPTNEASSQLPDANDFSEDEDDPPVLEFARMVGIARDHQLDDTSVDVILSMKDNIDRTFSNDLNHLHLPQFNIQAEFNVRERPFACKETARILTFLAQNESQDSINALIYPLLGSRDVKKMRVELPLLRSDHEFDVRGFARKDGFEVQPQDIKLPLELISVENNEGLEFPPEFYDLETETFETIADEKIEVKRSSMIYLHMALETALTSDDKQEIWDSVRTHPRVSSDTSIFYIPNSNNSKKFPIANHVTPPLSPILASPPDSPLHFLAPACEFQLLSDPSSLTSLDLKKIEDEVFKEEMPDLIRDISAARATTSASNDQFVKPGDLYSSPEFIKEFDSSSSPLENTRITVVDMKVEELLTPSKPFEELKPKAVRFNAIVEELLLSSRPQSVLSEPTLETRFFEEAFGESGEQASHRVEQERLVDTRQRVEVPKMEFSISGPPWMEKNFRSVNASSTTLEKLIKDVGIDLTELWPGLKKLHLQLPWIPFKHELGNIAEESMGDEKSWMPFVHGPEDDKVLVSSDLTWKTEGLRILLQEVEDDDDELEIGYFPKEVDDMSSLPVLDKQRSEIEDVERRQKQGRRDNPHVRGATMQITRPLISPGITNDILKLQENIITTSKRGRQDSSEEDSLLGGIFSAKSALSNFLEMRGAKKPKLIASAHFPAPNAPPLIPPNQASLSKESQIQESPIPATRSPLPAPTIIAPQNPITIILSSTLLKNRPLMRSLQSLLPTLKFCERDFSAHNTTIWNPGSVIRSPITSSLTHEADITTSPTTGLILTTLQHIKQRPLPGHKTAVPIRDRLEKVSARYESLTILVSAPSTGFGDSECIAWADFEGFALTLSASVSVIYVPIDTTNPNPNEGETTIAKYISHLIIQHNPPSSSSSSSSPHSSPFEPLDQESYWEIWLRRAGMNAYAAQATISELKAPEPSCRPGDQGYELEMRRIEERGPYGLALFVRMGVEERVRRLGGLVGRGVVERVSGAVDRGWE
ncbi:hypothetical protein SBOR_7030 [Sclerotinia borealis F-4128]|uniref:Uncharacterized protein n=1 Tax=Sclerotinia borealis (strain F-4128) TaxID=1432307 RepID=W9C9Y3_SCLBF|nr:hypothetical protein SBOR_7030 [Sclerotinia borealis F-4128]